MEKYAFYLLSLVVKGKKCVQTERRYLLISLISSWRSSFRITFSAVFRSASVGLEQNFAFLSTVSAYPFVKPAEGLFCTRKQEILDLSLFCRITRLWQVLLRKISKS